MKLILLSVLLLMIACQSPNRDQFVSLQKKLDSLQERMDLSYKPGFGEFMSNIQSHHAKLWFAGLHENWPLCDFEIHEIMESMDDIELFETDRPESKMINMIRPALDSVNSAINLKNPSLFKSKYTLLTATCNTCHEANHFEFNVVKIPEANGFYNQDFSGNHK
ncbi:MAG: hypothetical protein ABI844_15650 [Saprospiraceae bacterium]